MFRFVLILVLLTLFLNKGTSQEITIFPGFFAQRNYQDKEKITKKQLNTLMLNDPESAVYWNKYKTQTTIMGISIVAYFGAALWASNSTLSSDTSTRGLVALGALISAVGFSISARKNQTKAVLEYNDNLDATSLNLQPTNNGLGLVLSF